MISKGRYVRASNLSSVSMRSGWGIVRPEISFFHCKAPIVLVCVVPFGPPWPYLLMKDILKPISLERYSASRQIKGIVQARG
jgi:hypothetical protein